MSSQEPTQPQNNNKNQTKKNNQNNNKKGGGNNQKKETPVKVEEVKEDPQPWKKDYLLNVEKEIAEQWDKDRIFEVDAPETNEKPKYFATFPYPYMNGRLHLGHTFTISKAEFAIGYQALKGKNVLFPFAFHCTGMPIKACADKLKREMEEFGNPPQFPKREQVVETKEQPETAPAPSKSTNVKTDPKDFHSKKGKATSKKEDAKYQWEIMQGMAVPDNEIPKFADAAHWLDYFPPLAQQDLKRMGVRVDWRRSFITTDVNPYYDSFVRWQFNTLKELGRVKFGKRYSIYSAKDGQPCADHDRQTGEGVQPQEYTLIKQEVAWETVTEEKKNAAGSIWKKLEGRKVYLVPATLRPETMYGQTNTFVLPDGTYGAYEVGANNEVWIMAEHAAKNLSYQGFGKGGEFGKVGHLGNVTGEELLGLGVKAPLAKYPVVYVLPMMTISLEKGTGVVTSVPSDAPDDYAALMDLKNKAKLREKYGIKEEMVVPFEVVPIINVPGMGDKCAVTACERLKIKSQNDTELLKQAKEDVYKKGFYEGIMAVGEHAGKSVQSAKPIIRKMLIKSGQAAKYSEPESAVMSRSGDLCVSAKTEQWYLTYGEAEWKAKVKTVLSNMETYGPEARHLFENTLGWLKQWGCSRTYGLGTKLPFDERYMIESLSDSTIYMAYYTVAHMLQGDLEGHSVGPSGFKVEELTNAVWNYIFKLTDKFPEGIEGSKAEATKKMRREFEYWYPVDLRVSGKDLIPNHLTMFLYNHAAIWPVELCPRGVRANGHVLLNGKKMSKSTGNFLTLSEAIEKFSIDGMRLALADAGDSMDDANFLAKTADSGVLKLYTQLEWAKETIENIEKSVASGSTSKNDEQFHEDVFTSAMNKCIQQTEEHYEQMRFRDGLLSGFYGLQEARDMYRLAVGEKNMKKEFVYRFLEVQALLLSPICPHFSEALWMKLLKKPTSILKEKWPVAGSVDEKLLEKSKYLHNTLYVMRTRIKYMEEKKQIPQTLNIFVAKEFPAWKQKLMGVLKTQYRKDTNDFPETFKKDVSTEIGKMGKKKETAKMMSYVAMLEQRVKNEGPSALEFVVPFDEKEFLTGQRGFIKQQLNVVGEVQVFSLEEASAADPENRREASSPLEPSSSFVWIPKPEKKETEVKKVK